MRLLSPFINSWIIEFFSRYYSYSSKIVLRVVIIIIIINHFSHCDFCELLSVVNSFNELINLNLDVWGGRIYVCGCRRKKKYYRITLNSWWI